MSVMCLSDGSHWPATAAEYQKKKKRTYGCLRAFLFLTSSAALWDAGAADHKHGNGRD